MNAYILGVDQSTQGTKVVLFDENGAPLRRCDKPHAQMVNDLGWVSHDPMEIYDNLIACVRQLVTEAGIDKAQIRAAGLSNQRETTVCWDAEGKPLANAVVWQCSRAAGIAKRHSAQAERIRQRTGLPLSPYFPAAKMAWLMENTACDGRRYLGTVDSWLVYKLTGRFQTDYSNASRTQLFNLRTLAWDEDLCRLFGVPLAALPEVTDSDACFGYTDFEGFLDAPIPIHAVLGDSHAALYGQGCHAKGMVKATYGTGSSIMMNAGPSFTQSHNGLAASLAWRIGGRTDYVLEGNVNYTGAVVTWLKDTVGLIDSPSETEALARRANPADRTVLVPAFSGLGAPHWVSDARAMLCGMARTTGKAEIVKAALESIAYQVNDVVAVMEADCGEKIRELRADGGPTGNAYLMQFQSDLAGIPIRCAARAELSAVGAAYLAGIAAGVYRKEALFSGQAYRTFTPALSEAARREKAALWRDALRRALL